MTFSSFIDEDWTGLTHRQIRTQIISELEERQCKADGHKWTQATYCSNCGGIFEEYQQEQEQEKLQQHQKNEDEEEEQKKEKCKEGNHVFMYSTFCDRCYADFDEWRNEVPKKVTFDLIVPDLNKVLDEIWKERRITRNNSIELYNRMKKRAEDRGYIK
jgi:hypothetical protein